MNLTDLFFNARAIGFAIFMAVVTPPLFELAGAVSDMREAAKAAGESETFNRHRAS